MLLNLSETIAAAGGTRVYRDATVIDGSGAPRFVADVVVEAARVIAVIRAEDRDGRRLPDPLPAGCVEIDARGLALAPGFIDMHAHSDLAVLRGADHTPKLLQGVTCEVIGQDGLGYAPLDAATADVVAGQIAGWNGLPERILPRTMAELLAEIDRATAGNVAVLVPQGTSG